MDKSREVSRLALIALGTVFLPVLAGSTAAAAASPRTTPPIGTQLGELNGSDVASSGNFGRSVAIAGTTAVVGADPDYVAGRAYVFSKTA